MRVYELVTILESDKPETTKGLKKMIEAQKGTIEKEDKWGRRPFAYPIKKRDSGYYITYTIKIPQNNVKNLKKKLDFDEAILRYLMRVL